VRAFIQLPLALLWNLVAIGGLFGQSEGSGPLPFRNYQPLQQIFLNFPFERARVLPRGAVSLAVEVAHSNEIATDRGRIDAVLKFEQNRTGFVAVAGLGAGTQCALEVPFGSRFGGFLDPLIDSTEDLFGAFNPERKLFPNNSFGGFEVRRGEVVLWHGPRQTWEIMDSHVRCQWQAWNWSSGAALALKSGLKFPTGRASAVWGSGHPDLGVGAAVDVPLVKQLWLYGNLAGVRPFGPLTPARLNPKPLLQQAFGIEWLLPRRVSIHLQQELYTSPLRELPSAVLGGTVVELALGASWRGERLGVQLGAIDNVSGVAQAADFTAFLRVWTEHLLF